MKIWTSEGGECVCVIRIETAAVCARRVDQIRHTVPEKEIKKLISIRKQSYRLTARKTEFCI